MSDYMWEEPSSAFYGFGACPTLVATVTDDVDAELYVEYQDGVRVTLAVRGDGVRGGYASTDKTADWPEVERFIPRAEWPEEIYAGVRGPAERTPDAAVADAVSDAVRRWEDEMVAEAAAEFGDV